jgi:hypothetical protein
MKTGSGFFEWTAQEQQAARSRLIEQLKYAEQPGPFVE